MPELPEVETIRRDLAATIVGKTIAKITITWERAIRPMPAPTLAALVQGQRIVGVRRRAKYLGIELSGGKVLVAHLRMTGRLLVAPPEAGRPKWVHNWIDFADGSHLWFQDVRKFGRLWLVDEIEEATGKIGPEPIEAGFGARQLAEILKRRTAPIKPLLLQQEVVSGVGNIYADEALFDARIDPHRPAASLKRREIADLSRSLARVLRRAVAHRGSSIDDFLDVHGEKGHYKSHLKVYGRKGETCVVCGRPIVRETLRGRGTFWCPNCQK